MKQEEVIFPYVYGSMAFSMGKKNQSYTHKWICYVRGVNNQDLSYLLKKVVFKLHASFENPIKQIYKPPYQIQELGWGQFQILIQLHFNHPDMPPIQVPHMLKLHYGHSTGSQISKKPLCSEIYDQVVFTQVDQHIMKILQARQTVQPNTMVTDEQNQQAQEVAVMDQPLKSMTNYSRFFLQFDSQDHKGKLQQALKFIKGEINSLQEKMRIADMDIQKVYEDLYNKI